MNLFSLIDEVTELTDGYVANMELVPANRLGPLITLIAAALFVPRLCLFINSW